MSATLPRLMDTRRLMAELDISRATAERIIRHIPKQEIPGCRKLLVRRADVERFLAENVKEA